MTLHHESRVVGVLSYHVDNLTLAGDESDTLHLSSLETIRKFERLEQLGCRLIQTMCGCNDQQKRDGSTEVDQTGYSRANQTIHTNNRCSNTMNIKTSRNEVA